MKTSTRIARPALTSALLMALPLVIITPSRADAPRPLPHRIFGASRTKIDATLARPYDSEVPFGASGDIAWATSPQGWAFRDGVHLLYISDKDGAGVFDLTVRGAEGINYLVDRAEYAPSHVHMTGAPGSLLTATASYTYVTDKPENPLSKPFTSEKRWTCWNSGHREDTYTVDFGKPRALWGCDLYFFSDIAQGGGCAPPESVKLELYRDGSWHDAPTRPIKPQAGKTNIAFLGIAPAQAEQIRFTFRNAGAKLYTGLYGVEPSFADEKIGGNREEGKGKSGLAAPLLISADKWITQDDVLVTRLEASNLTKTMQPLFVAMNSPLSGTQNGFADQRDIDGYPLYLSASGTDGKTNATRFLADLKPGEKRHFTFACAVAHTRQDADKSQQTLALFDPLHAQETAYQQWFDDNTAYFACSDPLVSKMYWHRWYNVKKNSMNPGLGHLRHRTFAEGRWTSDWYANVISYGAGHQIDESRWLRDPSYAWGHVQTWAENPRPDGVFPSHISPKGQEGGQYTDWITATAWDTYLVHPDKKILNDVADSLAHNVEGWRKTYGGAKFGYADSPLLVVDSHWWTGMEWQPSFFSFADYKTGGGSGKDRKYMTPLRRVDLTAYNFANAANVANAYRELGRVDDARRFQQIADDTQRELLTRMWNPQTHWFHSLRAEDNRLSPTREIIGLYPFAFDLPMKGQGFESVWSVALDPALFWTTWPLASVSKDCPAYAQNGWPIGPGGSICMWNGPSWPHANSLVMNAMANTLRHYDTSALTREKLLELFTSFTRVQYKNQDSALPWTGEFYNGDTGEWKTTQRDYNHSTWIDPLVRHLIGLVPRNDDTLEIDSLLPEKSWSYYVLDGQSYRGHDVTVAWDETGGRVAPGFKGYAVYLDGKEVYRGPRPTRVLYDMKRGRQIANGR